MKKMRPGDLRKLVLSLIICQMAGVLGSFFTSSSVSTWYTTLEIPWFTPPGASIGFVWLFLFTLMGISLFLVWREGLDNPEVKAAIYIFAAQLVFNVMWSWAFFGLRSPLSGLAGDCNSMGLYTVDDHQILAYFQDCRTPFGSIPTVGELCRLPQLHNLVIEPLNP